MEKHNVPKIIHYCWFGGNKKSDLIEMCIESWHKFLPEYEIKEWNETNFDVNCCRYVKEAYENKKWAFVSDYCRFVVLNQYGGIYLDTDVEIIKHPGQIFESECLGFETVGMIAPGLVMASLPDSWLCRVMLEEYNNDTFVLENGKMNYKTVCERATAYLTQNGLVLDNTMQNVNGITIYPIEYFNPYDASTDSFAITENTVSKHHYASTWVTRDIISAQKIKEAQGIRSKMYLITMKILGPKTFEKLRRKLSRMKAKLRK
jgi:mannosyltransferase OCH1-like enzyme